MSCERGFGSRHVQSFLISLKVPSNTASATHVENISLPLKDDKQQVAYLSTFWEIPRDENPWSPAEEREADRSRVLHFCPDHRQHLSTTPRVQAQPCHPSAHLADRISSSTSAVSIQKAKTYRCIAKPAMLIKHR